MIIIKKFIFSIFLFIILLSPVVVTNKFEEKKNEIQDLPPNHQKKIAFLFLIRYNLPFLEIWQEFFTFHAPKEYYNIYVHSSIPYVFEEGSVFYNRTISEHIEAKWGTFSIVRATRFLLTAALLDDANNYYFALFSESCIPLYAFSKFYRILSADTKSIVFTHKAVMKEIRWNRGFDSKTKLMKTEYFRKSSQWFMLNRKHALLTSSYTVDDSVWEKIPAADEFFIPSTLAAFKLENETTNSGGFAFVNWTSPVPIPHPQHFKNVDEDLFFHFRFAHAQFAANLTIRKRETLRYHLKCAGYYGLCHFTARKILLTAKFQLLAKLSFLLIDDRDDLYLPLKIPLSSSFYYEDRNMFHHSSLHDSHSSYGILNSYPGYDYAKHLFPKVRKCIFLNNGSNLEDNYSFHYLDYSTKEKKLFPNFYSLRFFLRLTEKEYPTRDLLIKIPTIAEVELEKYVKHKEEQFPSLHENLLLGDKEKTWIIQSFERHLISPEKIQELFDFGTIKSIHAESMPEIFLEQIPIGKPIL